MALVNYSESNIATGYFLLRNWNDADYYYIKAKYDTKLAVPKNIIESNVVIVVSLEYEPDITIVDNIYLELVINLNINPNRIVVLSENSDLSEYINKVALNYNKTIINYEWVTGLQYNIKLQTRRDFQRFKNFKSANNNPSKIFLNFNRRWSLHRPLFVALCAANDILNFGHVSLGESDDHQSWQSILPELYKITSRHIKFNSLLKQNENKILSIPKLYLDTPDLVSPRHYISNLDIDNNITDNLYKQTMISVVTETLYFEEGRFLSEKTFKPIAYQHPFILIAKPKSLELLKELGYKTFSPYIDESYDSENNPLIRLQLIMEELKRLCNFSLNEIQEFLSNTEHITKYNFNVLINQKKHCIKKI